MTVDPARILADARRVLFVHAHPDDETLATGAIALAQNFGTEAEVDSAYDQALAAGAEGLKRPERVFWGGYSGYVADPDGHVWEYAVNPFWPLAEDGSLTLPEAE